MAEALQEEIIHQNGTVSESPTHHQMADSGSHSVKQRRPSVDKDAQDMVIDSLRVQIQDLISQVSQLNNKLVKSYDRVSDLEDDVHVASANLRTSTLKISQLELERTQHLSALNTGLLVEKSHVTAELTRLMEKATEEAAQRGQAESAKIEIERDLDDLSATLFGQANTMVAEARYARHLSERKVENAELALKSAEEAVQLMQVQMQLMQSEREEAEKKAQEMESMMGKGKWVERQAGSATVSLKLLSTHTPYHDYLAFLSHLRLLHPTSPSPPGMSTLLPLPFLARLLTEDSEPTVRLDLAPSLNWLSRRSVLAAIHSGQLSIEPISAASLFAESSAYPSTTIAGLNSSNDNISCALCGTLVFQTQETTSSSHHTHPPSTTLVHSNTSNSTSSWSGGFFKMAPSLGLPLSQPSSPIRTSPPRRTSIGPYLNSQVYIFRLASTQSSGITSLSISSLPTTKSSSQSNLPSSNNSSTSTSTYTNGSGQNYTHKHNPSTASQTTTIYPLCMSGWCLARLRTTCTLWAFVRTGVVEKVWEEEIPSSLPPPHHPSLPGSNVNGSGGLPMAKSVSTGTTGAKPPPIPPRKRGIWGIASAIGERAASWGEGDKEKNKQLSSPAPPPHPSIVSAATTQQSPRRLPPPLPSVDTSDTIVPPAPPAKTMTPPPLPRRSEGRSRQASSTPSPPPPQDQTPSTTAEPRPTTPATPTRAPDSVIPTTAPLSPIRSRHLRNTSQSQPLRTQTPSNVPLPDSRPATPVGGVVGAGGVSGPSRTASPATVGGAAPPPIPRRAAARARVVAAGGSRPVTPANAESVPEKSQEEQGTKEEENKPSDISAPAPAESKPTQADEPTDTTGPASDDDKQQPAEQFDSEDKINGSLVPDRSLAASPGSDDFVDALSPGQEVEGITFSDADKAEAEKEDGAGTSGDLHTIADAPVPEKASSSVDILLNGAEENESLFDADAEADDDEKVARDKESAEAIRERKEKEEKEKACYVGDSTWEEKTWREIVRLREDMFWARVGGIRQ